MAKPSKRAKSAQPAKTAKPVTAKLRYSFLVPAGAYRELKIRAAEEGSSVSALIAGLIEHRFGKVSREPLPIMTDQNPISGKAAADWVRASVFLAPALYAAAAHEAERQHGKTEDSGIRKVLWRVVAAMVSEATQAPYQANKKAV